MGALQPDPGTALHTLFALVFPSVGVLLSAAFSLSPLPRLVRINKQHDLAGYDPLPPVLNLGSGVAWTLYSVMAVNPFTFASGAVAAASSTYALLVAHAAAHPSARRAVEHLAMALMGVFLATCLAVMLLNGRQNPQAALATVGIVANAVVLAVYVSPLKNMWRVIRTRDASSIYAPWSALQFLNLLLWTVYGLCVMDVWILASSAFGLAAAAAALLLKAIYRHPPSSSASHDASLTTALPIDNAASSSSVSDQQQQQRQQSHKGMLAVSPAPEQGGGNGGGAGGASLVHGA